MGRYLIAALICMFTTASYANDELVGPGFWETLDHHWITSGIDVNRHPDLDDGMVEWTEPNLVSYHMGRINALMQFYEGYRSRPFVRHWSNLTEEEIQRCPVCDPAYNEIVITNGDEFVNEIWLTDEATPRDMIRVLIMYVQIRRGMTWSMAHSSSAKGERDLVFNRWERYMTQYPGIRYTEGFLLDGEN